MEERRGTINLPTALDIQELKNDYLVSISFLDSTIGNWDTMTGTQKQSWVADHMDEVLKIQRATLRLLKVMITT